MFTIKIKITRASVWLSVEYMFNVSKALGSLTSTKILNKM
jgi:hypothetical protein